MAELNNNDGEAVLSPVEQAVIVLLSIGEEPAAAVLRCLEREELIELTQVMSRMSGIKVDSVSRPSRISSTITASRAACTPPRAAT